MSAKVTSESLDFAACGVSRAIRRVLTPVKRSRRALLLVITVLSFVQSVDVVAQSPDSTLEPESASLKDQCRQLKKEISRQLAKCPTVFQLGQIKPMDLRRGWDQRGSGASVPRWVPRMVDLARRSNLADRALPIRIDTPWC